MTWPPNDPPHHHGGNPQRDLARFSLEPRSVLDFSVNLSPLGPPAAVERLWPKLWQEVEAYPSLEGEGVKAFYAQRFGLAPESVLPGNGATELLYLVPRALGLERVVVLQPAYNDYARACRLAGAQITPWVLDPAERFAAPSPEALRTLVAGAQAVFLGNPNNPTGTLFDGAMLRQLALETPETWWLVDESFIQFTDDFPKNSLAFGGPQPPNVLVFHSLTKFYALAGLRLGTVLGAPQTIARLRALKEPWSVNGVADSVARELAGCRDYEGRLKRLVSEERRRLSELLGTLPGLRVFPGAANFLLAQWHGGELDDLLRYLLQEGLCVRDCRNFPGLEEGFFRIAVRGAQENSVLLNLLMEFLAG